MPNILKSIVVLFFFFKPILSISQVHIIKSVLIDLDSREPLAFASVICKNQPIGTFSNKAGYFEISVPNLVDTVVVSIIGYESRYLLSKLSGIPDTIYLKKDIKYLSEVKIKQFSGETSTYGIYPNKARNSVNIYPGSEFVYLFKLKDEQKKQIVRFRFFLINQSLVQKTVYRINIYSVDSFGTPGTLMNKSDIIIEISETKPEFSLQLYGEEYFIDKNGIFIGVESIGYLDENNGYTYGNSKTPIYFKFETDKSENAKAFRRINKYKWVPIREGMSSNKDKPYLVPCFQLDIAK